MITIYGCPKTRSIRAVWAMEEAGAAYEYAKINLAQGEGRQPSYRRVNPGGKVPALEEGNFVLTESAAICTYIGDKFPDSRLTPPVGTQLGKKIQCFNRIQSATCLHGPHCLSPRSLPCPVTRGGITADRIDLIETVLPKIRISPKTMCGCSIESC